jgi:transcriptional regulator with XRE-family HTH domain
LPSIDVGAKTWQLDLSARVGKAIQKRRKVLGLTAQQLAQRTTEVGYPVSRVAISKIEANVRAGKFDVAEWLVLSEALQIPPALLLYPDYPDLPVEGLPGVEGPSVNAVWWISGRRRKGKTTGTELVALVEQRAELMWQANKLDSMLMTAMMGKDDAEEKALMQRIRSIEEQLEILEDDIRRAKIELWGES